MKRFFLSIVALFTGCIFPEKNISCEGTMIPYTGPPAVRIRRLSEQHTASLLTRTRSIALATPATRPIPNGWELLNKPSINVSLEQEMGRIHKGKIFVDREGSKSILTRSSSKHLCAQHGDSVGIDDPLPLDPMAKPKKYRKNITKTANPENELYFCGIIDRIINDPKSEIFEQISMRGIKARAYYTPNNYGSDNPRHKGFMIGVVTEGENAGRLVKAQPINSKQLKKLREFKIIND